VGRAGRRTGNAFLLTVPDRRRRDLYFLDSPRELIAGVIVPPGCYLSAVEILRRQYLAHLLDLAAAGRLVRGDGIVLRALPAWAPALFGPSGYLVDLTEVATAHGRDLVDGFLDLFPTGVNDQARAGLREYATGGLRSALEEAERHWNARKDALRHRLALIEAAQADLHDADPEQHQQKEELSAEHRGIGRRLRDLGDTPAQQALCDLGLLPNYALMDSVTTLSATLYWEEPAPRTGPDPAPAGAGRTRYSSTTTDYERPRRLALSELAPGNTFYVNGYRHEITGIEITTGGRRDWHAWRVCPECGYVRTENAAADRSACPRCASTTIADDGSCLFQVVEPVTVTSRDKREDARIRDDRDNRDQRFYTVVDAVDFPQDRIEPGSWRHTRHTFGVDYCRTAVIRRFNVGPQRFDAPARDRFAGHEVRLAPFHVCTACGAATADGKPVFDHDTDALTTSAVRLPALKHHRPWCPLRRGKPDGATQEPVLLAHQLRTEALRVLLPAAAADVEAKVHSFRAALRMGIDLHFGGDPQHLSTTVASMPDSDTGERRWFLVVFDALPGGTGYLDRLTDPDAFRDTLRAAHHALDACPCAHEGRRACHRCLHRYTPERLQDIVSRHEALTMLESLLDADGQDGWSVTEIEHTGRVGLDLQVESDLEARFLAVLRNWARHGNDVSLDEDGHASGHLRFTSGTDLLHWRLTAQREVDRARTRTDFTFTRVDGPTQRVHVYLDGHRFHATAQHNRIADDAAKRSTLRAHGDLVFQISWDDVAAFEHDHDPSHASRAGQQPEDPVWPPYGGAGQEQAKTTYEHGGRHRARLAGAVFTNPINTLITYLRDPDLDDWKAKAAAVVSGLLTGPDTRPVAATSNRADLAHALHTELLTLAVDPTIPPGGARTPAPGPLATAAASPATAPPARYHLFTGTDTNGLSLIVALDATDPEALGWSALTVLNDADTALDTFEHHRAWRAWLYWTNLLQFLTLGSGQAVQLAASRAADFDAATLTLGAPTRRPTPAGPAATTPTPPVVDSLWEREILHLLREEPEESPDLLRLAETLAAQGKQAPIFGYELGTGRWLADLAWDASDVKVAVLAEPDQHDDPDTRRRDTAFADAGWTARTATAWLNHLDDLLTRIPDVEGRTR
jgi:hypothetical protein